MTGTRTWAVVLASVGQSPDVRARTRTARTSVLVAPMREPPEGRAARPPAVVVGPPAAPAGRLAAPRARAVRPGARAVRPGARGHRWIRWADAALLRLEEGRDAWRQRRPGGGDPRQSRSHDDRRPELGFALRLDRHGRRAVATGNADLLTPKYQRVQLSQLEPEGRNGLDGRRRNS